MKLLGSLSPRWRKTIYWSVGIIAFYTLFGFFALPAIVKSVACKRLTKELGRETTIQQVKFNPYALSGTIRGFLIKDKDGQPFASWDEIYANFQASSLYSSGWDFIEFRCQAPYLRVEIGTNGVLNFADLLTMTNAASAAARKPGEKPRPLRIGTLRLDGGSVAFNDFSRSSPFETVIGPFDISVDHFSTASDNQNPYAFAGSTKAGEKFSWAGDFFLDPIRSHGEVTLEGLGVDRYSPFYQDNVRFRIHRGLVEVKAGYDLNLSGPTNRLVVTNASLHIKALDIAEKGSSTNAVAVSEVSLTGGRFDLLGRTAELERVALRDGRIHLRRLKDGSLDLAWLFQPTFPTNAATVLAATNAPAGAPAAPAAALIRAIVLENFAVTFDDLATTRPVHLEFDQLAVNVKNVSNQPGTNTEFNLALRWNSNGVIRADGAAELFPPKGFVQLALTNIGLLPLDRYLDPFLNLTISRGAVGLDGRAQFLLPTSGPPVVSFKGNLQLNDFATTDPAGVDFAKFSALALRNLDVQLEPMVIGLGGIELDDLVFHFVKDAHSNNLAGILKPLPKPAAASSAPPPRVDVASLVLSNAHLQVSDLAGKRPVEFELDQFGLKLKNVSNQAGTNVGIALATRFNTNGSIRADGEMALFPPKGELKLNLERVSLTPFDPYLEPFVNLLLVSGALGVDGRTRFSLPSNAPPAASFQGDVRLDDFAATDSVLGEELVKWSGLALRGLNCNLDPLAATLDEVALSDFTLNFVMSGATNNLATVLKSPGGGTVTNAAPAKPAAAAGPGPKIALKQILVTNMNLLVTDRAMKPPVTVGLRQIVGSVAELSSEQIGSGTVALSGKVDNVAPFNVNGRVSLLTHEKNSEIKAGLHDVDLAPFGPYIQKFAGYVFIKGRLDFDIDCKIVKRQVTAKNLLVLDQFTLGETVNSPDAIKAPIKFGLALLRDGDGKIELDLPIEGSLDDPNFRYGKVVWKAVGNIFLKAATAPFALLGSLFGGKKAEDLAFQEFAPGSVALQGDSVKKLEDVTKALQKRPALKLDITGGFDPAGDTASLRSNKLAKEFRLAKFTQLRESEQKGLTPEQVTVTPAEYTNFLFQTWMVATNANPPAKPKPMRPLRRNASTVLPRPLAELEQVVLAKIPITEADLKILADDRAKKVKTYLVETGKIGPDRLFLAERLPPNTTNKFSRVYLQLR